MTTLAPGGTFSEVLHIPTSRTNPTLARAALAIGRTVVAPALLILNSGCSRGTPQSREAAHLAKGKQYVAGKEYRKAIIEFKVASQNMPKDPEPLYQLGLAYMKGGASTDAVQTLQRAVDLDPKHEGARYELALFQVGSDKPDLVSSARTVISAYLSSHPKDAEAMASIALADAKLGDKAEALSMLDTAVRENPSNLRPVAVMIAFYAAKGDIETARSIADATVRRVPSSPDAAVLRAEIFLATRDIGQADGEISRALALNRSFQPALQLRLRRELMDGNSQNAEQTTRELSKLSTKQMWSAYARMLFAERKIPEGIAEFQRVLKEHPDDVELRNQYSGLLIVAERRDEAAGVISTTLAKWPKDAAALLQNVRLQVDRGRLDEASKGVTTLQSMKLSSPALSYQQSRIFGARGETLRQGDLLLEALKLNPHFLRARLDLVQILLNSGKAKEALVALEQAGDPEKSSAEYAYFHNMTLMADGNWPQAKKGVDDALAKSRTAAFLYQDAVIRSHNQDLPGMRKSLEAALAMAPSDAGTLNLLGSVMRQQGEEKKFVEMLRTAIAKNPSSISLHRELGARLAGAGDTAGARAALEAAKAAGDVDSSGFELALLDLQGGAVDKARTRLLDLINGHDSAKVRILLADVETRRNAPVETVVQHYLKAIQMESANVAAMNNLADTLAARQNKLDDALFWAQKALALAPTSPAVQDTLGWIYYKQGKYDTARTYLERSLRALDRPTAHYHLAAALAMGGDKARGAQEFQLGLKQDPNSPARATVSNLFERKN
ncbi:MAG: uncharacterized protein JWN34_4949 [Bryobacterales bacterium]|nr:uncharacterized protein [Bryobacterales bacterium]